MINKVTCHHHSVGPAPETAVVPHLGYRTPFVDVQIGQVENTVFRPTREELLAWLHGLRASVDDAIAQFASAPPPPPAAQPDDGDVLPAAQVAI